MNTSKYKILITDLEEESSKLIPMLRSEVYPKIIREKDAILPFLKKSMKNPTVVHYLTLLAILELGPNAINSISEDVRLKIYMDALKKGGQHNDWGLAGQYISGASLDILNIGNKAIPYLYPLLNDISKTGIWGSEEVTVDELYQNRMCDFIYFMINKILERDESFFEKPKDRDIAIEKLKKYLKEKNLSGQ